jgi:signal transduction histidine kinase
MTSSWSSLRQHLTEHTVLRALVAGFSLVMLLLGTAGFLAVREGRAIRASAAELVREQILITRLLHEAQVEEDALALVLHRLTRTEDPAARRTLMDELTAADQAIARLADEASSTPQAQPWRTLADSTRAFSAQVRATLESENRLARERLDPLFASHEVVVHLIHQLILKSTAHLEIVDRRLGDRLQELARESAALLGASLALAAACAVGTIAYVRHSLHRAEMRERELNHVTWHMLQSQEETARRFSHELHDELGQSLAAVRANLTRRSVEDPEALRADSVALVDEAIANVRELSQLLRPVILDDFGLEAGLRWLSEKFALRTRIHVDCHCDLPRRLDGELETHLFRIAQEALTNVARHSNAARVAIRLDSHQETVCLQIADDGRGLPLPAPAAAAPGLRPQSLGLTGMRARARECGGTLELTPAAPHGLIITVRVPARWSPADSASPA